MKKKIIIISLMILCLIPILLISGYFYFQYKKSQIQKDYILNAISEIDHWSKDSSWIKSQKALAEKQIEDKSDSAPWLTNHFFLMNNGDYLIYFQNCGKINFFVDDVFIAKGSDGSWYCSGFHYCKYMFYFRVIYGRPENLISLTTDTETRIMKLKYKPEKAIELVPKHHNEIPDEYKP
jgi:hypothetical protein